MRLNKNNFVPTLEGLEERTVPSSTALGWSAESALAASRAAPLAAGVTASPQGILVFGLLPANAPRGATVTVVMTAQDGRTFNEEFTISGLTPAQVRGTVLRALTSAGVDAVVDPDSPTSIDINGIKSDSTHSYSVIKSLKVSSNGLPKGNLPEAAGVKIALPSPSSVRTQTATSTDFDFQFEFDPSDSTSVLLDDATVEATIDGVAIDAPVTAGMGSNDVAGALYNAMLNAGITDAVLVNGNVIDFQSNTQGQEATTVNLTFVGQGGAPVNWIDWGVNFAYGTGSSSVRR